MSGTRRERAELSSRWDEFAKRGAGLRERTLALLAAFDTEPKGHARG